MSQKHVHPARLLTPCYLKTTLFLPSHLCPGLQSNSFHFPSPNTILHALITSPMHDAYPNLFILNVFINPNSICNRVHIMRLTTMHVSPVSCYILPSRSKHSQQHPVLLNSNHSSCFAIFFLFIHLMICQHLDYTGSMADVTTYSISGNSTGTDFSPQTANPCCSH